MWVRLATAAMGTRFELVLAGRDAAHARAAGEAALELIQEFDARYSRFRTDSVLARIHREAGAAALRVDPQTFQLLARCLELRAATGGAFDVAVGAPMDRLRAGLAAQFPGRGGSFELDAGASSVRLASADTRLDLGGIGKGLALDQAVQLLRELGVRSALLHGGTSSVIAFGLPPQPANLVAPVCMGEAHEPGYGVSLGPCFDGACVNLAGGALSVSAALAQGQGQGCAHVLDPRSGRALNHDLRAAVCADSAADADAWSTALLVLAAARPRVSLRRLLAGASLPPGFQCLLQSHAGAAPRAFRTTSTPSASLAR